MRDLFAYRGTSSLFRIWWPSGDDALYMDYLYQPVDPADAASDGYWIMLAPLHVERHTLHRKSVVVWTEAEDGCDWVEITDITYHVKVTPKCSHR